jgi:hypothetical protein
MNGVMRGLDPRIHPSSQESFEEDCRVKPGNDEEKTVPYPPILATSASDTSKFA